MRFASDFGEGNVAMLQGGRVGSETSGGSSR